ncbi:MAG TPA: DUF1800 domain-containing protein [Candidatus Methylomirabilis sp.]|nr:DUF1800 domain-containing protein [Candidatus Methylomirabilis sp.]
MRIRSIIFLLAILLFLGPFASAARLGRPSGLPYQEAGLTQRQAAAILLDRFAFGARPGEIDRVVAQGLEIWLEEQLSGNRPEHELVGRLAPLKTLTLSSREIATAYPGPGTVRAQAIREGVISRDDPPTDRAETRQKLQAFAQHKGYRPQRELSEELMTQKLLRGVYSENRLTEVLVDFWYNHFNVSITNNRARPFVLSYERDAIRPHVLGHFRDLIHATAKHPDMLLYLDNAQSTASDGTTTTMSQTTKRRGGVRSGEESQTKEAPSTGRPSRQQRGINENYARELMELHTLGVDGGYTQQDVIEVARVFTGWTVLPPGPRGGRLQKHLSRANGLGFAGDGDFLFRADTHDATQKIILGKTFPPGGGMEEGERVLDMLARHPATARRIATKLAVRFVSDRPAASLVDRLTQQFQETAGDVRALVRTIANSPEFWQEAARRSKIKSPYELVTSALRALQADVEQPRPVIEWIARMGQPLYAYQAPTGYPDRAEAWVNTGSLLNRMNFGLHLAAGRIPGIVFDLPTLNRGREPESVDAALETYAALVLPERDLTETLRLLTPVARDLTFGQKVDTAARRETEVSPKAPSIVQDQSTGVAADDERPSAPVPEGSTVTMPTPLAQVVGVILGAPEFQRR